jgi:hypothetical protein
VSDVHASLSLLSVSSNFTRRQPLTATRSLLLSYRQQHKKLGNLQALSTARQEPGHSAEARLQVELQQVHLPQALLRARAMDDEELAAVIQAEERRLHELLNTRASAAGTSRHQRASTQAINVPAIAPGRPSSLIFPANGSRPIAAEQQKPMLSPRATASSTLALPPVPRQQMQQPKSGFIA